MCTINQFPSDCRYIDMVRQACHPDNVQAVLADAGDATGAHVASMVYWVARLYSTAQHNKDQAAGRVCQHQLYAYLLEVARSLQGASVGSASMQRMHCALYKLRKSTDAPGEPEWSAEASVGTLPSLSVVPAAVTRALEPTSDAAVTSSKSKAVTGVILRLKFDFVQFSSCCCR